MNSKNEGFLDKYFKITERGSNIKVEMGAGLATFMTMSYILIVHPMIMKSAGMPANEVFTVTAITSCVFTLLMGLYAKLPFALAPAMGSNAFLAMTLVGSGAVTWQQGLAMNFVSGIIFLIMSIFGFREVIVKFLPKSLKLGIGAAVGIFLIELGFKNGGLMKAVNGSEQSSSYDSTFWYFCNSYTCCQKSKVRYASWNSFCYSYRYSFRCN